MSILDRDSLEQSPLADLHAIASELSIDSYRRMRKADLIDAILTRQGGEASEGAGSGDEPAAEEDSGGRKRRWRRGGRGGKGDEPGESADEADGEASSAGDQGASDEDEAGAAGDEAVPEAQDTAAQEADEAGSEAKRPRRQRSDSRKDAPSRAEPEVVEGVVEVLAGGSGFVRVHPPDPSDDDVYISSAQIKRCELVSGDQVSGPRRAPRRSERFASLVRVDTVNGRPAEELADSVRFEDRPVAFPDRRLKIALGDVMLRTIDRVTPIGRGSRVTISGPGASGKTETLRRLAATLSGDEELQIWVVLVGARPEELAEWQQGPVAPAVSLTFAASSDAQSQALDGVVEQVRRLVARRADAVMLIDTLDGVTPSVARKALASARNVVDGGSLTVIATSATPLGGETTVIALERASSAASGAAPAIDEARSWTIKRELLT